MIQKTRFCSKIFVTSFLMILISLVLFSTAFAVETQTPDPHGHDSPVVQNQSGPSGAGVPDNDMMDICQKMMANNSMMGSKGTQMMQSVEVNAMGPDMHNEMQGLVAKMAMGTLSSSEQTRVVEIMNKYPGPSNMMMTRMMGSTRGIGSWSTGQGMMATGVVSGGTDMMGGSGMMNSGFMTGGSVLIALFFVVWLVVGILLIIFLVKKLQKSNLHE
jgi:hypothetical protein